MNKPLLSGRFFFVGLFSGSGLRNPPNPLCKGGTVSWARDEFWRSYIDSGHYSRVALRFPLCKGGQGGFNDSLLVLLWSFEIW